MRKKGIVTKNNDEIMPVTWSECVLVNKEIPLSEVLIEAPQEAEVGQILAVKAVDEHGKPTEWEVVNNAAGSSDYDELDNLPSINGITLSGNKSTDDLGLGTYSKPSNGIPKTDFASSVQTSLGKADTALQSYTEKYTGTYSKPSNGIPKTDLASAVQTSLGKADTALQSEKYTGTVTRVKVGDISFDPTNGIVSLPAYPTSLPSGGGTYAIIPAGSDLKTYVTPGCYRTYVADPLKMKNLPSGMTTTGGFVLIIEQISNEFIMQRFYTYAGTMHVRFKNGSSWMS